MSVSLYCVVDTVHMTLPTLYSITQLPAYPLNWVIFSLHFLSLQGSFIAANLTKSVMWGLLNVHSCCKVTNGSASINNSFVSFHFIIIIISFLFYSTLIFNPKSFQIHFYFQELSLSRPTSLATAYFITWNGWQRYFVHDNVFFYHWEKPSSQSWGK